MPIVDTKSEKLSPWVTLDTKTVNWQDERGVEVYHSLSQADYVSMLAITVDGRIPLVRQFRPGCETSTLELPGGMLEEGEDPKDCARRELFEEVGFDGGEIQFLAHLWPDPGRLSNRLHCYLIKNIVPTSQQWQSEAGLKIEFIDLKDLTVLTASGQLHNAHHVAIVGLAMTAGFLS